MPREPYDLLIDPDKTTLTCPGGVVLGYGPGPGLRHAIFWNRVGSLFSCYRPAVAVLSVFDARNLHHPVALRPKRTRWEPNLCTAVYSAPGLRVEETRTALRSGLRCMLKLTNTGRAAREWVLFFHGAVEQWPFFDYQASLDLGGADILSAESGHGQDARATSQDARATVDLAAPQIRCEFDVAKHMLTLTQPHPHDGLPPLNSIQTVSLARRLDACGFAQSEGELASLWHDHGALTSLRLRLGQVGGRFPVGARPCFARLKRAETARAEPGTAAVMPEEEDGRSMASPLLPNPSFTHRHPVYYFATRIRVEPGTPQLVGLMCSFRTDDAHAHIEEPERGTTPEQWRRYLREDVPQLSCSDKELERYWYYVWYVLRANRTAPGAHVKHPFTAPSKYLYWGPWIWDGYFHVLGEMWLKDPEVAKDTIRAVLDMQFPNGYIPVCSGSNYRMCFHDKCDGFSPTDGSAGGYASYVESELKDYTEAEHPYEARFKYASRSARVPAGDSWSAGVPARDSVAARDGRPPAAMLHNEKTQTPLITVAVWEYMWFHHIDNKDWSFAHEVLPKLWAYEEWLWRRRTDDKGRFILWHGDESGWDDATRHYPVPAKPFDVQVHALMHRRALMYLAGCCNEMEMSTEMSRRQRITERSLRTYWDSTDRWHYDFGARGDGQRTGRRRKQIAPSGLFAMLVNESPRIVDPCLYALRHDRIFNTPFPIPTLAADDPDYRPHGWGWNGPVWLQVNYFTIVGLLESAQSAAFYGETERADALYKAAFELWEKTRALIIRDGKPHSYELYDPESGTGMGCPDYSWQAMINHLIIRYFAGVGFPGLHPALPPGMDHLAISNLPGWIKSIAITRDRKHIQFSIDQRKGYAFTLSTSGLGCVNNAKAGGAEIHMMETGAYMVKPDASKPGKCEIILTCH